MRIVTLLLLIITAPLFGASMSLSGVTERMMLSASMKAANIGKGLLISLNMDGVKKTVDEIDTFKVDEVIKSHSGANGSVCFVVRRPG
mmetsp:Transcript_7428/g.9443  ORF Transcript_7428/g.9443 Transcript_7428/m.9443 type:complete len:88 (-) Transcript_7428:812-1075(-)